jgi:phenylpyruvate tautomerase PptA (4-oxalocrotonate tautomerase family)
MPLYEVSYVAPLTGAQKNDLALALTKLQCNKFGTPSLFVTVVFLNITKLDTYVAGKPVSSGLNSVTSPMMPFSDVSLSTMST